MNEWQKPSFCKCASTKPNKVDEINRLGALYPDIRNLVVTKITESADAIEETVKKILPEIYSLMARDDTDQTCRLGNK